MLTLKKQLPPLSTLVAFEAAARHLSFTRAAEELNLSQAAVSQQIRVLEKHFGIELFIRSHRSIRLSARGREFQHTVSAVLKQLATASAELMALESQTRLTVAADQSIASMWLMPRLPRFQERHGDIAVRIIASDDEGDCLKDDVELAIIHGDGSWPGFQSSRLFGEEIFPVCSPDYLDGENATLTPEALVQQTLLDLDDSQWNWMNWRTWLSQQDIHLPARHRALQVNNYPMLIHAARNGQGIALGWRHLVNADLESGRLIRATEHSVKTRFGYYMVWPESREISANARLFREWCREQQAAVQE